jgi:uncharacterized protein YodC (DUF2158 family)
MLRSGSLAWLAEYQFNEVFGKIQVAVEKSVPGNSELKSGGPVMTILSQISDSESYWCPWFAGKKNEKAHFPAATLRKIELPS